MEQYRSLCGHLIELREERDRIRQVSIKKILTDKRYLAAYKPHLLLRKVRPPKLDPNVRRTAWGSVLCGSALLGLLLVIKPSWPLVVVGALTIAVLWIFACAVWLERSKQVYILAVDRMEDGFEGNPYNLSRELAVKGPSDLIKLIEPEEVLAVLEVFEAQMEHEEIMRAHPDDIDTVCNDYTGPWRSWRREPDRSVSENGIVDSGF